MKSALLLLLLAGTGTAQLSLAGKWKMQAGDDLRWAAPGFDDGQWSDVVLPSILFQSPALFWLRRTAPAPALTFLSDGVIEATNSKGELFGFEHTAALSMMSAREIAEAAQTWGQNDDITVVTVRRSG